MTMVWVDVLHCAMIAVKTSHPGRLHQRTRVLVVEESEYILLITRRRQSDTGHPKRRWILEDLHPVKLDWAIM